MASDGIVAPRRLVDEQPGALTFRQSQELITKSKPERFAFASVHASRARYLPCERLHAISQFRLIAIGLERDDLK
jgi:hypothetical protein